MGFFPIRLVFREKVKCALLKHIWKIYIKCYNYFVRKETKNWLETSEYDLNTAEHLLSTGRYLYVIFICQLSIEKMLKALYCEDTGKLPPKTHDLVYLLKLAKLEPPENIKDFIGKINNASIITRYPEDLSKIISDYPEEVQETILIIQKRC